VKRGLRVSSRRNSPGWLVEPAYLRSCASSSEAHSLNACNSQARNSLQSINCVRLILETLADVRNHPIVLKSLGATRAVAATAQHNLSVHSHRMWAMGMAAASMAAMLYVGLYQSRAVRHIWCPVFARGCEAVADAQFAKPFGIPDGYIAATLYGMIFLLLLAPTSKMWIWITLLVLGSAATLANFLGVRDMVNLDSFCFYCIVTTALSPALLSEIWRLR
jgi:uncharacterized membrane protein